MTLVLRDETFIQWKPSIVSWAIALGLIGAQLFAKISLLKMMGAAMTLEDSVWSKLTYSWAAGRAVGRHQFVGGKQLFHGRLGDL